MQKKTKSKKPKRLTKAQLERRRRLKGQRARRKREQAYRTSMAANGLCEPVQAMSRKAQDQLRIEWYKRLAESESAKPAEERFVDLEWQSNPNSPHISKPGARGRAYDSTKLIYYNLAQNFLTHHRFKTRMQRYAWTMHTNGKSYREILDALKAKYGIKKSIYWIYYYVQECAVECIQWNRTHPEGNLNPANQDSFADDALISNWSLQLDEGHWQNLPKRKQ